MECMGYYFFGVLYFIYTNFIYLIMKKVGVYKENFMVFYEFKFNFYNLYRKGIVTASIIFCYNFGEISRKYWVLPYHSS